MYIDDYITENVDSGKFKAFIYIHNLNQTYCNGYIRPISVTADEFKKVAPCTLYGSVWTCYDGDPYKNIMEFELKFGLHVSFIVEEDTEYLSSLIKKVIDLDTGEVVYVQE